MNEKRRTRFQTAKKEGEMSEKEGKIECLTKKAKQGFSVFCPRRGCGQPLRVIWDVGLKLLGFEITAGRCPNHGFIWVEEP